MRKIIFILALCCLQFIFTLCEKCDDCPPGTTIDRTLRYVELGVTALNTAGFANTKVQDTIEKEVLGLEVALYFSIVADCNFNSNKYGLNTLIACPCEPLYTDTNFINDAVIKSIEIFATDVEQFQDHDVSNNFRVYNQSGKLVNLNELAGIKIDDWQKIWRRFRFQFELVEYKTIPTSAVFTVNFHLTSSRSRPVITGRTQQINFYK